MRSRRGYDSLKRLLDVVFSGVGLVVLSPLLLIIGVLVWAKLGAPVIFRQRRPGKMGEAFTLYKFRTMRQPASGLSGLGASATDIERLTPFGSSLRSTSLDELPELWNVLKGDMSIIGPRPLLPEYLGRYNAEQSRRHEVRPGITGWAQVNGRNAVSWSERLAMDVWYVDNRSLALDARIAWMTLAAVLSRRGISAPGSPTMEPFEPEDRSGSPENGS